MISFTVYDAGTLRVQAFHGSLITSSSKCPNMLSWTSVCEAYTVHIMGTNVILLDSECIGASYLIANDSSTHSCVADVECAEWNIGGTASWRG